MASYDLLSYLKDDSDTLDETCSFAFASGPAEVPMPPMAWPRPVQQLFDDLVADQAATRDFLISHKLVVESSEPGEEEEEEESSDEEAEVPGGEVVPFTRLDYVYSKLSSDKVRDLMLRISELGFDGNEVKEAFTILAPIYAAYKSAIPSVPKQMNRVQISNYRDETTTETTEIGPFYLRKLVESEAFPGFVECNPGEVARLTISGVTVSWNDSEVGENSAERAALAAVLSKHFDKSKQIVFLNCAGLGKAHSILVNTFLIKKEEKGFDVTERTILRGIDGYGQVRKLDRYHTWFDKLIEIGLRTKDAWDFHNQVQIYIYKNRKGVTKTLLDHVLVAENEANQAAEDKLRSLDGIMSRGINLPQLAQMQNQIGQSKREGRNYGANQEVFRSNASLYGKAFNSVADHAENVALAKTIMSLGVKSVVVGCAQNEGKRMHRAFQAEKLSTENYDPATNSWHQLSAVDLKGKAVLCASYSSLMTTKKTVHPTCLENVLRVAEAGADMIITTWKTEEFVSRTSLVNQEWFSLMPSRFNKFQFMKAGKAHTTHFYLFMWAGEPDPRDETFPKFILSAMQQTVRMAYVLEQFTAAGCRYGVKPDMSKAVPLVKELITEKVGGALKKVLLDRNVTFRLNVRTISLIFDPKAAGPAEETIEAVDNKDSKSLDSATPKVRPTIKEIEKVAVDAAEPDGPSEKDEEVELVVPRLSKDVEEADARARAAEKRAVEERRRKKAEEDTAAKVLKEKEAADIRLREAALAREELAKKTVVPVKPVRPPKPAAPKSDERPPPRVECAPTTVVSNKAEVARLESAVPKNRNRTQPPKVTASTQSRFSYTSYKK